MADRSAVEIFLANARRCIQAEASQSPDVYSALGLNVSRHLRQIHKIIRFVFREPKVSGIMLEPQTELIHFIC